MLCIRNVTIPFENQNGLKINEIEFEQKGITLLTGENGCGKSSLLRAIAGLSSYLKGRVMLNNQGISLEELRSQVTYLSQKPYLFDTSVYKNLAFPIRHLSQTERARRIQLVVEEFGLSSIVKQRARALSGGQKQRIAIARAELTDASWMLFDEPYSGLDQASRETLSRLINRFGKEKAVILTSHEPLSDLITVSQHLHIENQYVKRIN